MDEHYTTYWKIGLW